MQWLASVNPGMPIASWKTEAGESPGSTWASYPGAHSKAEARKALPQQGERRELASQKNCPLPSTCPSWHVQTLLTHHIRTLIINKVIRK